MTLPYGLELVIQQPTLRLTCTRTPVLVSFVPGVDIWVMFWLLEFVLVFRKPTESTRLPNDTRSEKGFCSTAASPFLIGRVHARLVGMLKEHDVR